MTNGNPELKEVDFRYCQSCKFRDLSQGLDPCNDCLEVGMREGTSKPEKWEEAKNG